MASVLLYNQAYIVPNTGGTYWYSAVSYPKAVTLQTVNLPSPLSYSEGEGGFYITVPSNSTSSERSWDCYAVFAEVDDSTATSAVSFTVRQSATNKGVYFTKGFQTKVSSEGGTVDAEFVSQGTNRFRMERYNRPAATTPTVEVAPSYSSNYPNRVSKFSSVADFRNASIAGEIPVGNWVYIDGIVTEVGRFYNGMVTVTFKDSTDSQYEAEISGVKNLGNVNYTSSNYTEAANITTIGFKYTTKWGETSDWYSTSASSNYPFAYTQNGVTIAPGERNMEIPPEPISTGYTVTATISSNTLDNYVDHIIKAYDENNTRIAATIVRQSGASGKLELQYETMDFPGDPTSELNKLTHTGISYDTLETWNSSGSGNFTPSIIQKNGETYLKVQTFSSNIDGTENKEAVISIQGKDANGDKVTITCNVVQHTDWTEMSVISRGSYENPLEVGWDSSDVTYTIYGSNIGEITSVYRVAPYSDNREYLEFTAVPTTVGSYQDGYLVTVTIPRNTVYEDKKWELDFIASSAYESYGNIYAGGTYILQEKLPEGKIIFDPSILTYLHSYASSTYQYHFTTEYMDNTTITTSYEGDVDVNTTPHIIWNQGTSESEAGIIEYSHRANTTNESKTLTITLTGTDILGVERSGSITLTQVPKSEDSYIRFSSISSGTTYPYKDAVITGSFWASNVENFQFTNESGTDFIDTFEVTPTTTASIYEFTATLKQNNTDSLRRGVYRITGTNTIQDSPFGTVTSDTVSRQITQKCEPGSITLGRESILVPAGSSDDRPSFAYRHLDNTYTTYRLVGTITAELSGEVQGDISFKTYENKEYVVLDATPNETGQDLTGTITLSGTDYNGDTITVSYTVVQTADNPYIIFDPYGWITTPVKIMWDETATTFKITVHRVSNLTNFRTYPSTLPSRKVTEITGYTIAKTGEDEYTLVINTAVNATREPFDSNLIYFDWEDDYGHNPWLNEAGEGGVNFGEYAQPAIKKYAIPGTITLTPSARSVDGHSGTTSFTYSKDQWMNNDLQFSHSGDMNITKFDISGDQIIVEYGENRSSEEKVETITVTGTDYQGLTITATATITQQPLSFIEFVDKEKTIGPTESVVEFRLDDFGVKNIQASFSGNVNIISYSFSTVTGGHILSITTGDNLEYVVKQSRITVTATGQKGENLSTTAILYKNGPDGNITLSPKTGYCPAEGGEASFKSVRNGMDSIDDYIVEEGGLAIISAAFRGDPAVFTVGEYPLTPTYWNDSLSTRIHLTGIDYKGKAIDSNSVTIVQYGTNPDIQIVPEETTLGFEGGTLEFTVTLSGPVPPPTVNVAGTYSWLGEWDTTPSRTNTLRVSIPSNNTFREKKIPVTLRSTALTGEVITGEAIVVQDPKEGGIIIDPPIRSVEKEAGSTQFTITLDGVERNSLSMTYAGESIISASFTGNKSGIIVTYKENTSVSTIANTITVSGADEFGNPTSTTAELYQYGKDPSISANTIGIPNTQSEITVFVSTNGVGDLTVSFTGDVVIDDYTLTETTGGYYLTLVTQDNLGNDPLFSTATFSGIVTTGRYQGQTITQDVKVVKYGKEGRIIADPTDVIVKKAGREVVIDLSYNNMDVSTVTSTAGSFNSDKSKLSYTVAANPNLTDRTITITVSGTDLNGVTRSTIISIYQYGIDPYISISPTAQTIRYNDRQVQYTVVAYKANDLSVSFAGGIIISSYDLTNGILTINTEDNTELLSIMDIITVSGVSDDGETLTAEATLTKFGTGGGIIIDPTFTIAGGTTTGDTGLLIVPYYTDRIKENTIYAFVNGDISVTNVAVHREGQFVIIEYNHNSSNYNKTSTLTLNCYDEDDIPRTVSSTITQLSSTYTFTIKPSTRRILSSAGGFNNTVESNNMNTVVSFNHFGDFDATYTYGNAVNGVISATYTANTDDYNRYGVITITGVSVSGDTVVTNAYVVQNTEYYGDFGFEFLDSSQANVTVDGGGKKLYYDILSTNRSTGEPIPYYVSGFILTGYWKNLPSVRYRDGYPYIVIPINTREETRDVVATFMQEYSYLELYARIHQEEGAIPEVHPIWDIAEMTSSNGSFIEYHITYDGDIIYAGKAYRYPEELETVWSVNDVTSNYLGNGIIFTDGIQQIPNYSKDFFIGTSAGAKYVKTFYNSWAYKHTNYWLSDPIDTRVDPRQWLPVSFLSTNYPLINVGNRIYAALKEDDGWTVMTNLNNYMLNCNEGFSVVGVNGETIDYKVTSGDYVLYYSNAYGGWDSILLTGKVKKTDEIEHLNYKRRSNSQYKFSKINYQNNITPTWSLNTGISVNGSKMYHLLESTMVYLHNLETNEIIPVVITNSQCEYLTRRNNGKRPFFYTITVEESNTKLRK